jgi:two-component sensor histidine kinase
MVHEVLYRSANFEGVEMQAYFDRLVDYLSTAYEGSYRGIACEVRAGDIILDLDDAIPVALIVNELVSNSFKHAFPDRRRGRVSIEMSQTETERILVVCDDGVGFKATEHDHRTERGLGTELIHALAAQLRASLERKDEGGGQVRLSFPRKTT